MFTGIIYHRGIWQGIEPLAEGKFRARIEFIGEPPTDLVIGESIAVNGCCLTLVEQDRNQIGFDLLQETLDRTVLGLQKQGAIVNLERSLQVADRFGGHFLTGHVDQRGKVLFFGQDGQDYRLTIEYDPRYRNLVVEKGCIAIDGISLTVASIEENRLTVWLIPHTLKETHLGQIQAGDQVNLEFDLLAKYVARNAELAPSR